MVDSSLLRQNIMLWKNMQRCGPFSVPVLTPSPAYILESREFPLEDSKLSALGEQSPFSCVSIASHFFILS